MKIFYSDNHFYGVEPFEDDVDKLEFGENIYYMGDIVDVKNTLKSKVFEAQELVAEIEKRAGDHYVSGNHELNTRNMEHITEDGIFLTHGDIFSYGEEGAIAWRTEKNAGKSRWFRWSLRLTKGTSYKRKKGVGTKVGNTEFKEACYKKAKEAGCHTLIIGHKHPNKLLKEVYKGITIYVLPRGRTVIEDL